MVKAVVFNEFGDSDVLKVINNYELPPKQEGEVCANPRRHARAMPISGATLYIDEVETEPDPAEGY